MSAPPTITAVEAELARRRGRWRIVFGALVLLVAASVILTLVLAAAGLRLAGQSTAHYGDDADHFLYGSIGAEEASGLPLKLWHALPHLFPEAFGGRTDYAAFGFLYGTEDGWPRDLPIGISERRVLGVDLVWFNCAVCHTGTYRTEPEAELVIVAGMPANNLDLHGFVDFLLGAADDARLGDERVFAAIEESGQSLGMLERLMWQHIVLPRVREGLLFQRLRLEPLLAGQPPWGPGRVDTFNPYKVARLEPPILQLSEAEAIGAADFPSIFLQGPREGMQLHWDGNNPSLDERNLSAALGAGVTPATVEHAAIERVAGWLSDLEPPPSPIATDDAEAAAGREIYMQHCAACHGYLGEDGSYQFTGERLGQVEPIGAIGTDPRRLDSYTAAFRERQLSDLFADTEYRFRYFVKTDGYANHPLDGLWLRAPYLHNGSVPTLADLLAPPEERPWAFLRGPDVLDVVRGGFVAPPCDPGETGPDDGFCFDTTLPGNGNQGHIYGTSLNEADKAALLAYLLRF